jgi:hypothetical protein
VTAAVAGGRAFCRFRLIGDNGALSKLFRTLMPANLLQHPALAAAVLLYFHI